MSGYTIKKFPAVRNLVSDVMWLSRKKSHISSYTRFIINDTRKSLKAYNDGRSEKISLLSYIISCYAESLVKFKDFNSFRKGKKIYVFDNVDVSVIIEREFEGSRIPMNYIIRAANKKTLIEINSELLTAKNSPLGQVIFNKNIKLYSLLPLFIRHRIISFIANRPKQACKYFGTTGVTAVHTILRRELWGQPVSPVTVALTLGSITRDNGNEFINITLTADHELVDGAEGARFVNYFGDLVESGYGLNQLLSELNFEKP
mgnify:CR=1 FL=1